MEKSLSEIFIERLDSLKIQNSTPKHKKGTLFCELSTEDKKRYLFDNISISVNTSNDWYNRKKSRVPSVDSLKEIAKHFHVSVDYLLGNAESPENYNEKYIHDTLGLNYDAIAHLQDSTTWWEQGLLNTLLGNDYLIEICEAVNSYMQIVTYKEISVTDNDTKKAEVLPNEQQRDIAEFRATKRFTSLLTDKLANEQIIKDLTKSEHSFEKINSPEWEAKMNAMTEYLKKELNDKHMTVGEYLKYLDAKHKNNK